MSPANLTPTSLPVQKPNKYIFPKENRKTEKRKRKPFQRTGSEPAKRKRNKSRKGGLRVREQDIMP
jgi:hypothetical protein